MKNSGLVKNLAKSQPVSHIESFGGECSCQRKLSKRFVSRCNRIRISRPSRKSLLCKPGTANSRNTCVDMRLACVACRPLGVIRVLCSAPFALPSSRLSRNLSDSTRALSCSRMHPSSKRQLYPPLRQQRHSAATSYNSGEVFSSTRKSGFRRFPYALIRLERAAVRRARGEK